MSPKQKTRKNTNVHKKTQNSRKSNTANNKKIKENGAIQDEIILVITLVLCILLFLSNFKLIGSAGNIISGFIFGLIGLQAYILPILIFFITAFHISNPGSRRAGRKIISALVFFVALAALIQMLTTPGDFNGGKSETENLWDYFVNAMNNSNGGGIIGGILAKFLSSLFAELGAYIILIAMMIISFIVITGKALFTYMANKSKESLEERREYSRLMKEQREAEAEEKGVDRGRRPPKTFVLDSAVKDTQEQTKDSSEKKESIISFKDRKQKKEQNKDEKELPILNFHNLFDDERASVPDATPMGIENSDSVTTYEEELNRKFGQAEQQEAEDQVKKETTPPETAVAKRETRVEGSQSSLDKATTGVEELEISQEANKKVYIFPPQHLLTAPKGKNTKGGMTDKDLKETAMKLQSTLESFGVHVTITNASIGPAVTRYELQPEQGVKVSSITRLSDDIKLNLAASEIRIEAPIPGKAAVGIEVPNKENSIVTFRELIDSNEFKNHPSDIAFGVGKDIGGQTIVTDIAKMPHLLIAGATGSGKSVCINTLIMSILYKAKPEDVRLIMVDPKVVELNVYNGIPHLLIPVVTDPKKASAALNWAVMEMTERYKKFADVGAKDIKSYNDKVSEVAYLNDENYQKLPQIVIIIDELADLMMVSAQEVEDAICRLAQLARAAGLHLVIATQRPSVNVITGLIKANIPSRIAFAVSSQIDSRTIIDGAGAEKLLGKGDMLFFPTGYPKPVRIQGAFISEKEVSAVVDFIKKNNSEGNYSDEVHEKITNAKSVESMLSGSGGDDRDEYFVEAGKFIIEKDKASIGMLQRVYKIGFNRAARIMDQLADAGVVGPEEGTKPRKIIMSLEQFEQYLEEN